MRRCDVIDGHDNTRREYLRSQVSRRCRSRVLASQMPLPRDQAVSGIHEGLLSHGISCPLILTTHVINPETDDERSERRASVSIAVDFRFLGLSRQPL